MGSLVTILNFSGRNVGNCAAIGKFIADFHTKANICIYNVNEYFLPCGRCNYQCLKRNELCPSYKIKKAFMDTIMQSDLVYYIVPNYCGFPCANYFAFNEQTVGYFNFDNDLLDKYMSVKKRFIIVSNSESDTFLQAMQLQSEHPEILYLKTRKYGKESINGDLMDSEDAIEL